MASNSVTSGKKRKALSLQKKIDILTRLEEGTSQLTIAAELHIPRSTIQRIWSQRKVLMGRFKATNANLTKLRTPRFKPIDEALLAWFITQRNRGVPVDGPVLLAKAAEFASKLGITDFKASSGWLTKWKKRHSIQFKTIQGEVGAVDVNATNDWIETVWKTFSSKYVESDIYNCDETGLFYKMLPDRTFEFKGKPCSGGKHSKERLTVLLCCNMDGSHKLRPLVIGKFANPRCFTMFKDLSSLPVTYRSNRKAWMLGALFKEWLDSVNDEMKAKGRNILLLMDNCGAHPKDLKYSNVEILFLPPNATSKLQPLDQGIIKEVKRIYRRLLVLKVIRCMDRNIAVKISVLDCIVMLQSAWRQVGVDTIRNCFLHGLTNSELAVASNDVVEVHSVDLTRLGINGDAELTAYEDIDDCVETAGEDTEEDIIARVVGNDSENEELVSDPEEEPQEDRIPTTQEVLWAIEKIKLWLMNRPLEDPKHINDMISLESMASKVYYNSFKQSQVTDFFRLND